MSEPVIRALRNGPYAVTGKINVTNHKKEQLEAEETFYLCRCGQSQNKPFCDSSHTQAGFQAD